MTDQIDLDSQERFANDVIAVVSDRDFNRMAYAHLAHTASEQCRANPISKLV